MNRRLLLAAALLFVACKTPQTSEKASESSTAAVSSVGATWNEAAPVPEGIDASAMNWKANACEDFFEFACGTWVKKTEIPPDRSTWYIYSNIDQRNELMLKQILADDAAGKPPEGSVYAKQLGDFYATCIDESKLETSLPELKKLLKEVDTLKTPAGVAKLITTMHVAGLGPLFEFGSQQDFQDATQVIAVLDQGGIGLPDRDYYLKDDPKMKEVLGLYRDHVENVFKLLGDSPEKAKHKMEEVLSLETELAKASLDRVSRRDPSKTYHRTDMSQLKKLAPDFPWDSYFAAVKSPKDGTFNVTYPEFFQAVNKVLKTTSLSTWKSYLTYRYTSALTAGLPKRFQDEAFAFSSKALTGAKQDMPRWKKCVHFADSSMGEALGKPFVAKVFTDEAKKDVKEIVAQVEAAFHGNINQLAWMDSATREQAMEKLKAINNKVGYPDKWKTYDGLDTSRSSFIHNLLVTNTYESARDIKKIGKPVDRTEWEMTPPTVNAYYEPGLNEIALAAGILQPPLYSKDFAWSVNFGSTGGGTVGHELTHGFDDEGRHFDAHGNLRDWWTPAASKAFDERAACVANQFDQYLAAGNVHVNGKLTLGENVADLGGIKLGYSAYQTYLKDHPAAPKSERLTNDQAFFVAYAQTWCAKIRPEQQLERTQVDPHSPPYWRVNGPLSNLGAFQKAFSCKAGDRMVSPHPCEVW